MDELLDGLMRTQPSLKSLFCRRGSGGWRTSPSSTTPSSSSSPDFSVNPIPHLSPLANSVTARCCRILSISSEELQQRFDVDMAENIKSTVSYARNLLEFCSYQTIDKMVRSPEYLTDKEFSLLTFDMMLAWETAVMKTESADREPYPVRNSEVEEEDACSLFYSTSTSMAVQVDDKDTVGVEAFARIAPACAVIADVVTVQNIFDALTSVSSRQLHYLIYSKYLRCLDKVIKSSKNAAGSSISRNFRDNEIILDVDGTIPTQPVLKHVGISAWPGRLSLTNYGLYFESLGVGLYDKAVKYDLGMDTKQVIKAELTGPLGARLFDKAVMYKSTTMTEAVYFEFPEIKCNSRRDYWLEICLEVLHAHRFIRKYGLVDVQRSEALAMAALGIFRYRALKEAFRFCSSRYKTVLPYTLSENLPGGDKIMETLSRDIAQIRTKFEKPVVPTTVHRQPGRPSPVSLLTLSGFGFPSHAAVSAVDETLIFGGICVGETNPIQVAVRHSTRNIRGAEAAEATIDRVKVDGIDTNFAVMKELLFPFIQLARCLGILASWEDPFNSTVFLVVSCYATVRGWMRYGVPCLLVLVAAVMLWRSHPWKRSSRKWQPEPLNVISPPSKNPVEQVLELQEAISNVEAFIQSANILLLKIRAILFALLPRATETVAVVLMVAAAVVTFVPAKYICLVLFVEAFTRRMPLRRDTSDRWLRRVREWWANVPAAPVQLLKKVDSKKKIK